MLRWLLLGLVILAILAVVARFMARRRMGRGVTLHRLNPPGWMVWAAVFGAIGLTGIGLVLSLTDGTVRWVLTALALFYAASVALLFWYAFLAYFAWTTDGLSTWDPWRKHRVIRWSEAETIGRSPIPGHRVVRSARDAIHYPAVLDGVPALDAFLERRRAPAPVRT